MIAHPFVEDGMQAAMWTSIDIENPQTETACRLFLPCSQSETTSLLLIIFETVCIDSGIADNSDECYIVARNRGPANIGVRLHVAWDIELSIISGLIQMMKPATTQKGDSVR